MEQDKLEGIRATLETERAAVERQLGEYGAAPGGDRIEVAMENGFADSAHATAERSEVVSNVEQLQETDREISDALRRIEEGVYGKCERCGEEIPAERLEAIPTARLCVSCKQAARQG
jgi:DnaK suppressor protein